VGGPFDGGLAMCGPVGGMPYQTEYLGDFRVVFDYFYPGVFAFGAADVPEDAYLAWDSTYAPRIERVILARPLRAAQLFNVTGAARVPWQRETLVNTAQSVLRYSIVGTNDMIATAGGTIPYDNVDTVYSGSRYDDRLNAEVERVAGDPAYAESYYQPTGELGVPLVTLHTVLDEAVPFEHERMYHELVGDNPALTVLPVMRYGHCNFEAREVLGAFSLLLIKAKVWDAEDGDPFVRTLPAPIE
jgi:hypothetical protein